MIRSAPFPMWFASVASERATGDRKSAVVYEGTREIHSLMLADDLLGYRVDRPTRCELPAASR